MRKHWGSGLLIMLGLVLLIGGSLKTEGRVLSETDSDPSLDERVGALEKRVGNLERKSAKTTTSSTGIKSVSYLRLLDGAAAGSEWSVISGSEFWLDLTLYGTSVTVTWEGWLRVQDSNGVAYARLYDTTNNRAVDFSEVNIDSREKASFFSKNLTIWRGQNQYRVEVKSSTGYTVNISEARLKITSR